MHYVARIFFSRNICFQKIFFPNTLKIRYDTIRYGSELSWHVQYKILGLKTVATDYWFFQICSCISSGKCQIHSTWLVVCVHLVIIFSLLIRQCRRPLLPISWKNVQFHAGIFHQSYAQAINFYHWVIILHNPHVIKCSWKKGGWT